MRLWWFRHRLAALVALSALAASGCAPRDSTPDSSSGDPSRSAASGPAASGSLKVQSGEASAEATARRPASSRQDPARFAPQVRAHAAAAGISPQLLMAILYNESYKPHDPAAERAWHRIQPDCAFGVANMHEPAFTEAKQGRDFADRDWTELPDDPDLAIKAAAWHLHDLAAQLPASWVEGYTKDELAALGYNAGASSMLAFAAGATPGRVAKDYLDKLRGNWRLAEEALATED